MEVMQEKVLKLERTIMATNFKELDSKINHLENIIKHYDQKIRVLDKSMMEPSLNDPDPQSVRVHDN